MLPILVVILILGASGIGFVYNAVWLIAGVLLLVLLVGYMGGPPAAGGPRRWYGRW